MNHISNPTASIQRFAIDFDLDNAIRCYLISDDLADLEPLRPIDRTTLTDELAELRPSQMTELLLDYSLCPLHRIDFAICFDDDDPECAAIRTIYPDTHST